MNDVLGGETVGGCDLCGASVAAAKGTAFSEESTASGAVDCSILYHNYQPRRKRSSGRRELNAGNIVGQEQDRERVGRRGELTTPPPPKSDSFAALTIDVTSRSVIEVRMRATFELRDADGSGAGLSGEGWRLKDR